MTKSSVVQIRVSPEKKAEWAERSKAEGFRSLSAWIESACDARIFVHTPEGQNLKELLKKKPLWDEKLAPSTAQTGQDRAHAPNCRCGVCSK